MLVHHCPKLYFTLSHTVTGTLPCNEQLPTWSNHLLSQPLCTLFQILRLHAKLKVFGFDELSFPNELHDSYGLSEG